MPGASKRLNIAKFYRETRAEIRKVSWPNRKELIQHTQVVVTSIILVGTVLWLVDLAFGGILNLFLAR